MVEYDARHAPATRLVVAGAGNARGLDQSLLAEVTQVARAWVRGRAAGIEEITTGDHSERADSRERARLGSPQRVLASAIVNAPPLRAAREIHVPLEHVSRRAVAVTCAAIVTSIAQVDDVVARGAFRLPVSAARSAAERWPCVSSAAAAFTAGEVREGTFVVEVAGV